jgi:hypothetical protein
MHTLTIMCTIITFTPIFPEIFTRFRTFLVLLVQTKTNGEFFISKFDLSVILKESIDGGSQPHARIYFMEITYKHHMYVCIYNYTQ